MILHVFKFVVLNFAALAIGGLFTGPGVDSDWYANLEIAPWTPPGWVFGFMWTLIMLTFAFYMAIAWKKISNHRKLLILFSIQWILNIIWNPVFFYYQNALLGLFIIVSLTIIVGVFLFNYRKTLGSVSYFILPYFLWLFIATSLNAYILINN